MIQIQVNDKYDKNLILLKPTDCWGAEHGKIFQMYCGGKPDRTFFISCGLNDNVVMLWFDGEENEYKLSSSNKKELREFHSSVMIREIDAKVSIDLEIGL